MSDDLLLVTADLVDALAARATASPRRRMNHNLHPTLADPIQRLLNAFEPGTYVRPHRHPQPGRWELFLCLRGRVAVLTFAADGAVRERVVLEAGGPTLAVEIPPGVCHSLASLAPGTVLFELKPGPYVALADKDFAAWAPAEGEPACAAFARWLESAAPGDSPSR
jgi:cupin fold WbuC family metalloprotein